MNETAQKALEAYGGKTLWSSAKHIEAEVSVDGWAFTLKRRPFFRHAHISMQVASPFARLTPIGKNAQVSGVLEQADVYLEDQEGRILDARQDARDYFPGGRRLFVWDDLDMAYFANYAFWNYFTFPMLLLNADIIWQETGENCLQATFPDAIPTHSRVQSFYFDLDNGRLLQHNYTTEVIGGFAKAAHVIAAHHENGGVSFPSRRIVTPRGIGGKPLKWPVLIEIDVHHFEVKSQSRR